MTIIPVVVGTQSRHNVARGLSGEESIARGRVLHSRFDILPARGWYTWRQSIGISPMHKEQTTGQRPRRMTRYRQQVLADVRSAVARGEPAPSVAALARRCGFYDHAAARRLRGELLAVSRALPRARRRQAR